MRNRRSKKEGLAVKQGHSFYARLCFEDWLRVKDHFDIDTMSENVYNTIIDAVSMLCRKSTIRRWVNEVF